MAIHKLTKREHDLSSDHEKITSNPPNQKELSLTLTKFDEDEEEDLNEDNPNDPSYYAKDDKDDDDALKDLGMEPGAKIMAELVDTTHWHQCDLD